MYTNIIRHGGREFVVTAEMTRIFITKVHRLVRQGETELVPLPHRGGLELLLVSPDNVPTVAHRPSRPATHLAFTQPAVVHGGRQPAAA
jgi:hypothetical protein